MQCFLIFCMSRYVENSIYMVNQVDRGLVVLRAGFGRDIFIVFQVVCIQQVVVLFRQSGCCGVWCCSIVFSSFGIVFILFRLIERGDLNEVFLFLCDLKFKIFWNLFFNFYYIEEVIEVIIGN